MMPHPTDGEMALACWRREGISKSSGTVSGQRTKLAETRKTGMTIGVPKRLEKSKTKISIKAEYERRDKALDEAIENTFPASDPVSAEQPV
jgi:hypothetical protein